MLKKLLKGLRALRKGDKDPDWAWDERRELVRMRCHYDVEYKFGDKRHQGQIVDMSLGGMKLRCFQPPAVGDVVEVSYKIPAVNVQNQTVPCKVQWVRARERDFVQFVGLAYDASDDLLRQSWVKMVLKQMGFRPDKIFQRRKYVRADCFVPVRVVYQRVHAFEGRLYNLGVQGALVEGNVELQTGEMVELQIGPFEELPYFCITGEVAQQTKHHKNVMTGVKFGDMSDRSTDCLGRYLRHLLLNHWEA
ncbi:MAG: PilZ domain-containing protein [Myxococcota bacterium]